VWDKQTFAAFAVHIYETVMTFQAHRATLNLENSSKDDQVKNCRKDNSVD
jgi:hypothetical protein